MSVKILAECDLAPHQIDLQTKIQPLSLPPGLVEKACAEKRALGATVEILPLYRVLSYQLQSQKLVLEVSHSDYGENLALQANPDLGIESKALAICCLCQTPDGYVVEQRSQRVAACPGMMHLVPSGIVEAPETVETCLMREAQEELGLETTEIIDPRVLGLIRVRPQGVYQLIISFTTVVTIEELHQRQREGSWEQDGLLLAPLEAKALKEWSHSNRSKLTGGTHAAIEVASRSRS